MAKNPQTHSTTPGGRRYTVQGLEGLPRNRSAPDIRDQRPMLSREESVPEDLMLVYRNMNREVGGLVLVYIHGWVGVSQVKVGGGDISQVKNKDCLLDNIFVFSTSL